MPNQRIRLVEDTWVIPRPAPVRSRRGERDCRPGELAASIYTLFLNSVQVRMLWAAICDAKLCSTLGDIECQNKRKESK